MRRVKIFKAENKAIGFVLCFISFCLLAFCAGGVPARAEESADGPSECICRVDVTSFVNLSDNRITVTDDPGSSKVSYKTGKGKWKSITGLERDEDGSYLIKTKKGTKVSLKVKKGADVTDSTACFGVDDSETQGSCMRAPKGFDSRVFLKELFGSGFAFEAENGLRAVIELNVTGSGEDGKTASGTAVRGQIYKLSESGTATFMGTTSTSSNLTVFSKLRVRGSVYKVTAINKNACKNNKKIKTLAVPSSVLKIGAGAFKGASNLKTVTLTPSSKLKLGTGAFDGINASAKIKIVAKSSLYKKVRKKLLEAGMPEKATFKRIDVPAGSVGSASDDSQSSAETPVKPEPVADPEIKMEKFDIDFSVADIGSYSNWEGVSNISYLGERDGNVVFSVDFGDMIAIFEGSGEANMALDDEGNEIWEQLASDPVCIQKEYPLYGGMIRDDDGFFYMVTGHPGNEAGGQTGLIYVTKYSPEGDIVGQVIDDGGSSLGFDAETKFLTFEPFYSGNCVMSINNGILAVYYARKMVSGHQSDSLLLVNTEAMEEVFVGRVYQSHSFAQRIVAEGKGFLLASEGDCYDRAFVVTSVNEKKETQSDAVFHFGIKPDTLNNSDVYTLNNNFAHLGDIAVSKSGKAVLAATSARSMSEAAQDEPEDIFVQIFDSKKKLSSAKAYVKGETRKGLSGGNGDIPCTDHGVIWLTNLKNSEKIGSLHCVITENDLVVLLYEKYDEKGTYLGVYYTILDLDGNVRHPETCYWERARLSRSETPYCSGNALWWIGNAEEDYCLYKYSLTVK